MHRTTVRLAHLELGLEDRLVELNRLLDVPTPTLRTRPKFLYVFTVFPPP